MEEFAEESIDLVSINTDEEQSSVDDEEETDEIDTYVVGDEEDSMNWYCGEGYYPRHQKRKQSAMRTEIDERLKGFSVKVNNNNVFSGGFCPKLR